MGELRKIPGVGKEIEKDLIELGINSIDDLKGRDHRNSMTENV